MLGIIRKHLLKIAEDIDCGNTNLSEEEQLQLLTTVKNLADRTQKLSKYQACQYLRISRATFDNYIRAGQIPKGQKVAGFKELFWTKKDLDEFIEMRKREIG